MPGEEEKKPVVGEQGGGDAHINLKVKGQDGSEVFFRIKRSTQLKKLMNAYCDHQSLDLRAIAILFDDRMLRADQTPDELEMDDGDEIDAMLHQTGDIIVKDFDEGKETLQAKRRRMLQFCSDNVEMGCAMAADGLSESLQVNLGFSGDQCLLNCDGTEELAEEWLADCSEDSEPRCPPEEISSPAAIEEANLSVHENCLSREQGNIVQKNTVQARSTPLKAGKNIIRPRKVKTSVVYPFELIKPCGFHGDVTLHDINRRIHAPPPYKIKHKMDEEQVPYQTSAISGKPVVLKTKIHTEGGKGSITITRTRG
ncbi:hypothetical protein ABZP36_024412 [Zizania latifolia]